MDKDVQKKRASKKKPLPFHGLLDLKESDVDRYMAMYPEEFKKLGGN